MKTYTIYYFSMVLFICSCKSERSSDHESSGTDLNDTSFELVWSDEFDKEGKPDSSKWNYDLGDGCQIHPDLCGWGNDELQYYTDREENVRIENGILIIEARKESLEGRDYTSTRIKTKNKGDWQYGKIEVKAKLPSGTGTWPAIWMLPTLDRPMSWPLDGEIDIMEHVGFDPGRVHGTIHTGAFNHRDGTHKSGQKLIEDASDEFHVYSIVWNSDSISWLIDGEQYFVFENEKKGKEEWPFDNPFHLILNIAVGGGWGGQQGVDDSIWPQKMEVDWVRVYKKM